MNEFETRGGNIIIEQVTVDRLGESRRRTI